MLILAIVLTLAWAVYGTYCAQKDKPMILAYFLGLLLAALWCNVLNLQ